MIVKGKLSDSGVQQKITIKFWDLHTLWQEENLSWVYLTALKHVAFETFILLLTFELYFAILLLGS